MVDAETGVGCKVEGISAVVARFGEKISATNPMLVAAINAGLAIVETSAKIKVHVKSGQLKISIHTIPATPGNLEGRVYTSKSYGWYLEKGTKPHLIVPVKALALHFVADDGDVFTKQVQHPGSQAYPFMEPALEENVEDIKASVMLAIQMELMK
jgi:diaminopimelate epimerase